MVAEKLRWFIAASAFWVGCVGTESQKSYDGAIAETSNPDTLESRPDGSVHPDVAAPEDAPADVPLEASAGVDTPTPTDLHSPEAGEPDGTPTDASDCSSPPEGPLNVLFIGNSYTAANNLAGVLTALSKSLGDDVTTTVRAPGGYTLGAQPKAHAESSETLELIASGPWNAVVIQEQSQMPTIPSFYQFHTKTGGQKLADAVAAHSPCARILLFMTWGRRDGGAQCIGVCSEDYENFDAMQDVLTARYIDLANTLQAELAPVGEAWRHIRATSPELELFSGDGSHPNVAGTYLAAAVFHAALFHGTPVGATEDAGLGSPVAETLQKAAEHVVLTAPESWLP